jgi:monoterpene epsilon-lactone hydrolase
MAATRVLVRGRSLLRRKPVERLMAELATRDYPAAAPVPRRMREQYDVVEDEVDGCVVLRLTPRAGPSGEHLVYTHGGMYVYPLVAEQWWFLDRMARGSGVTVTVPLYRLAPEGGVDAAYEFLQKVYLDLVRSGPVTLAGDSSGGGLALGQAMAHREAGLPAPRQVILFAPWLDIALSNPVAERLEPLDPVLRVETLRACGRLWARDHHPRDPRLSPLFADLDGLPPVHTFQGGRDVLAADAQRLDDRLRQAGNSGTFTLVPTGFHVYLGAFWTTEARAALRAVNQLLRPTPVLRE